MTHATYTAPTPYTLACQRDGYHFSGMLIRFGIPTDDGRTITRPADDVVLHRPSPPVTWLARLDDEMGEFDGNELCGRIDGGSLVVRDLPEWSGGGSALFGRGYLVTDHDSVGEDCASLIEAAYRLRSYPSLAFAVELDDVRWEEHPPQDGTTPGVEAAEWRLSGAALTNRAVWAGCLVEFDRPLTIAGVVYRYRKPWPGEAELWSPLLADCDPVAGFDPACQVMAALLSGEGWTQVAARAATPGDRLDMRHLMAAAMRMLGMPIPAFLLDDNPPAPQWQHPVVVTGDGTEDHPYVIGAEGPAGQATSGDHSG